MEMIRKISQCKRIGIISGLVATLCYTCAHLFTQVILDSVKNFSPLGVLLIRGILEIIVLTPFLLYHEVNLSIPRPKWLLLITFCVNHFVANVILYYGLPLIPLADVFTLSAVAPIFASMFSFCILKERWTWVDTLSGITSAVGVLVVAKPAAIFGESSFKSIKMQDSGSTTSRLIGCACAFTFGILRALWLVLSRKWTQDSSLKNSGNLVLIFYASVFTFTATPFILVVKGDRLVFPSEWYVRMPLLTVGACTALGAMGLSSAVKTENASSIAIIRNFEVFESYIAQYIVFYTKPQLWSICGTVLIVASTIVASYRDKILKKCEDRSGNEVKTKPG